MEIQSAEAHWIQRAYEEAKENIQRKHQHGTGICSVFILDTSESKAGEGVRQLKTAFLDILNEYESLHLDDNIAVIGCGKEVKFLHYFSNNYSSIKKCLGHTAVIHPLYIRARVVVISDGNPTGLDMSSSMETSETTTDTENVASNLLERFPNEAITESVVRREYLDYDIGREETVNQVCEILNEREVYRDEVDFAEHNYKERYSDMPCVGTRVRRGCHWNYENQDNLGVGTVIGHSERIGWLHVEWDNGSRILHQFGHDGIKEKYDIRVCDEPRHIPENQQIANGCLVRKGPDWRWGNQNGSEDSIGTVYRIIPTGEVYVRWPNGNKSNYRFGYKDSYDLIMCDPRDPEVAASYRLQLKIHKQSAKGGFP
uniref:MIB/HERC2 domain-containing protein n=1 Tax=Magallana gigas TaxID=29159 RepID=A0A8W8LHZ3_MAGGI